MNIEHTILDNLVYNERYCRKVIPYIKQEYFTSRGCQIIFDEISKFIIDF